MPLTVSAGRGQRLLLTTLDTAIGVTPGALTANRAQLAYLGRLDRALTLTHLGWYVGTASGNVDLALVSVASTTATRLASTGSTAAAGTSAVQKIAVSAQTPIAAGIDLYAVISLDNITATAGKIAGSSPILAEGTRVATCDTQFPIGTSFTIATPSTVLPLLYAYFTG